ncbi:1050_t:CDS:2 [Cetraspora pellucida]|uniref:1050_t:CDS:1 n=1 Tax=Cetraspora pellucida TaxID=1433469 RepID=A0A9N9NA88_9GLOM|nr:1050_t:CDS:2 [Cetraspora pellucida]
MQTIYEPIFIADYNFPIGLFQKLTPLVYLAINSNESNETQQNGQLAIFIQTQWHIGSSSTSHIIVLLSLVDSIHGKPVYAEYINEKQDPFINIKFLSEFKTTNVQSANEDKIFVPWSWVKSHYQIC